MAGGGPRHVTSTAIGADGSSLLLRGDPRAALLAAARSRPPSKRARPSSRRTRKRSSTCPTAAPGHGRWHRVAGMRRGSIVAADITARGNQPVCRVSSARGEIFTFTPSAAERIPTRQRRRLRRRRTPRTFCSMTVALGRLVGVRTSGRDHGCEPWEDSSPAPPAPRPSLPSRADVASARHPSDGASMAWRSTRNFRTGSTRVHLQAVSRVHRIGQTNDCIATYADAVDTIDEAVSARRVPESTARDVVDTSRAGQQVQGGTPSSYPRAAVVLLEGSHSRSMRYGDGVGAQLTAETRRWRRRRRLGAGERAGGGVAAESPPTEEIRFWAPHAIIARS